MLAFTRTQKELGNSTDELEATVEHLEEALKASDAERERVEQRLQNLEAIVTSETWDALHEDGVSQLSPPDEPTKGEERTDAERADRLARRMHP